MAMTLRAPRNQQSPRDPWITSPEPLPPMNSLPSVHQTALLSLPEPVWNDGQTPPHSDHNLHLYTFSMHSSTATAFISYPLQWEKSGECFV